MFFKQLLATADGQITGCTKNLLKKLLQGSPSITVTGGFRKNAIFEMNSEKAPSSDGYAAHLFQVAWMIVRAEVVRAVLHFFNSCIMLPAFNSTVIITLVPKSSVPDDV